MPMDGKQDQAEVPKTRRNFEVFLQQLVSLFTMAMQRGGGGACGADIELSDETKVELLKWRRGEDNWCICTLQHGKILVEETGGQKDNIRAEATALRVPINEMTGDMDIMDLHYEEGAFQTLMLTIAKNCEKECTHDGRTRMAILKVNMTDDSAEKEARRLEVIEASKSLREKRSIFAGKGRTDMEMITQEDVDREDERKAKEEAERRANIYATRCHDAGDLVLFLCGNSFRTPKGKVSYMTLPALHDVLRQRYSTLPVEHFSEPVIGLMPQHDVFLVDPRPDEVYHLFDELREAAFKNRGKESETTAPGRR